MSFVATNYVLPSVTGKVGAVVIPFAPNRCSLARKTGIVPSTSRPNVIRKAVPRTRLMITPQKGAYLGNWFDSLLNAAKNVSKGIVAGAATGGPAGAIAGGAAGFIPSGKGKQNIVLDQQSALGPLATVSTGTIIGVSLGFTALIIALAARGR